MNDTVRPAKPVRKVRKKGLERRQQIIDTARTILLEAGVHGLVLRDVAERLNITHGNLQYYFATKDDLLLAIFDIELSKYTNTMSEAIERTSTREGRIAMIIDSGIAELKTESTRLWRMLFAMTEQSPALAAILRKENENYDRSLTKILGTISPKMPERRRHHIAQMIRMMLDGLGVHLAYTAPDDPEILAVQSEIRAAVTAWLSEPPAEPKPARGGRSAG